MDGLGSGWIVVEPAALVGAGSCNVDVVDVGRLTRGVRVDDVHLAEVEPLSRRSGRQLQVAGNDRIAANGSQGVEHLLADVVAFDQIGVIGAARLRDLLEVLQKRTDAQHVGLDPLVTAGALARST
jgi:hypothetical protein